jgi:uncharacterized RDD family membrane protein YckC
MRDIAPVLIPEKVIVSYRLAGLSTRVQAQILDLLCITAMMVLGVILVSLLGAVTQSAVFQAILIPVSVAAPFIYFILFEGMWNGQTPGKKALRLRTVMMDGAPIDWRAAVIRNLLRPADLVPFAYIAGIICMFMTPRFQRFGDIAAGTIVVYEPRTEKQFSPAPYKVGTHPLEDRIPTLRGMTMNDYIVIKRLCDRFPYLPPPTQAKMVADVWEPFSEKLRIPNIDNVHPVYLMEAVVMKFGREQELI